MRVWALPEVIDELADLVDILFEKGYFSYAETSAEYVISLFEDIIENLPKKLKRKAPKYFTDRYGEGLYYAVFPKSKRTQWYAFFRMYEMNGEIFYQVRNIENNHTVAQHLDIRL